MFVLATGLLLLARTALCASSIISPAGAQYDDTAMAVIEMNQARQNLGIHPMSWSSDLALYAQYWASQIATGAQPFSHAPAQLRPYQGENLFERRSSQRDWEYDNPLQTATQAWLDEGLL